MQTFLASKQLAQEKQLENLFELAEDEALLQDKVSGFGSTAPFTEFNHQRNLQGAACAEEQKGS